MVSSSGAERIRLSGFASGIDTQAIIDALVAVQQRPILAAQDRVAVQQRRKDTLAQINTSVANLLSRAASLKDTSVVGAKKATTNQATGEVPKLSVSASSTAAVGSFTVDVVSRATSTRAESTSAIGQAVTQNTALANSGMTVPVTTGTFTINGATVTIDAATVLSDGVNANGSNTILAKINNAGVGVTASVVNDSDGRANLLQLSSGSTIQLGSGGDTSNFLAAANLLQSPGTTLRTSTRPLAGVNSSTTLVNARLQTSLSAATGSFTINGVAINWDRNVDSLQGVIDRINSSSAGVTASYNATTDRVTLAANDTGSTNIQLADTSGNFLAATRVLAATQTLGTNASYRIDGGAVQYATTNTVTDAVAGVTLTLQDVTTSPITVTIASDNQQVKSRIQNFVDQFNSTISIIKDATKYVEKGNNGPLYGDSMLRGLEQRLRSYITGAGVGMTGDLTSLNSIGLNFGAVGSAVGATKTLAFDTAKFDAAVASNAEGVRQLLAGFRATASLDGGGTGSVASISGVPTTAPDSGKYTITSTNTGSLTVTFAPDNGGTPVVSTATIAAGGTNTTAIPGVTITAKGVLVNGTDTITIAATQEGVGKALHEYIESFTRSGGIVEQKSAEMQRRIDDINKQIETMNKRVEARREYLVRQYAQLEVTLQQLQGQQTALSQMQSALNPRKS